jgi:hypothetical protein
MKSLTTLTAVVCLIAGLSIASAQNSTSQEPNASPSSVNKGDQPTKSSGAQHMNPSAATTGSAVKSPAADSKQKVKSPASPDSGIKQEKWATQAVLQTKGLLPPAANWDGLFVLVGVWRARGRHLFCFVSSGNIDDFEVLDADRKPVGRILRTYAASRSTPWFWSITAGAPNTMQDRGYAASREAAMADFKAAWGRGG